MKPKYSKAPAERVVKDIRRQTRKQYSAEEKIRMVLEGLRGEDSIADPLVRRRRSSWLPLPVTNQEEQIV